MAANNRKIKFVFLWLLLSTTYIPLSRKLLSTQFVYAGDVP